MANQAKKGTNNKKPKSKINVFNFFSVIFIIICTWYANETRKFYSKHKRLANQSDKLIFEPDPKYLLPSIPICIFILILKRILIKGFTGIADKIVRKDKYPEKEREDKVKKCALNIYKSLNYISLTIIGYSLLKDESYLPPSLGGHGDVENMWVDLPYQIQNPKLRIYYLVSFGYHLHSLIDQFKYIGKPNFGDMMLHHIITVFLIVFSFLNNYVRIGALVLLVHDVSDICGSLVKIFINSKYEKLTLTFYFGLLASWIYFRLYVYPFQVINSAIKQVPNPIHEKNKFLILLMASLVVLHIYWFIAFLLMIINYIRTDEIVNIHDEGFDKMEDPKKKKVVNKNE